MRSPSAPSKRRDKMCDKKSCIDILTLNLPLLKERFKVTALTLFGSMARGDNREDSDVDILVEMPSKILLVSELQSYLEDILNSPVDLIHRHKFMNRRFLNKINRDAIRIL